MCVHWLYVCVQVCSSMCLCAGIFTCVSVCMCISCVSVCRYVYLCKQEVNCMSLALESPHYFLRQGLRSLFGWTVCPASPWCLPVSIPPLWSAGVLGAYLCDVLSHGWWRPELRAKCFQRKHFSSWTISPVPENHLTVSLLTLDTNTKKLLLIGKDIISLYLNLSFFLITEETSFTCLSALYFFCDLSVT